MNKDNRAMLLRRIQMCDFVLTDTALYLDTHPTDANALEHYRKHSRLRAEAHKEYVEKYGPTVHEDFDGGDKWNWTDGPWPWQNKEEK